MGISCLLESNFPTRSSTAGTEESRGKTLLNPKNPVPRVECWVSQCEQQTGEKKSQTHTLHEHARLLCTKDQRPQRNKKGIEIIRGVFFSVLSPLFECLLHSSLARCETNNHRAGQNHSAVLELNANTSIFPSRQQRGEPAATEAKGRYFGAHSDTRIIFSGII